MIDISGCQQEDGSKKWWSKKILIICFWVGVLSFLSSQQILAQNDPVTNLDTVQEKCRASSEDYDQQLLNELEQEYTDFDEQSSVPDPLEPYNRLMFRFNDSMYTYLFKPLSQGYAYVLPEKLRQSIDNAFYNIRFPIRFVNNILEARFNNAVKETGSFLVNTIFGFMGLIKVSQHVPDLEPPPAKKDGGLTLGTWGVGEGIYIVWPFLGPKTIRSSAGMVGDFFLDPISYVDADWLEYGLWAEEKINNVSLHLGEYEDLKQGAVDPYIAIRNGYIQYRNEQLKR